MVRVNPYTQHTNLRYGDNQTEWKCRKSQQRYDPSPFFDLIGFSFFFPVQPQMHSPQTPTLFFYNAYDFLVATDNP